MSFRLWISQRLGSLLATYFQRLDHIHILTTLICFIIVHIDFRNLLLFWLNELAISWFCHFIMDKEGVDECFLRSYSLCWIFLEHFHYEIFGIGGESFETLIVHIRIALFNQVESGFTVLWLEWKLPTHKSVEYNSSWPDVNLSLVALLVKDLRRNICWRSAALHHHLIWNSYFG